MLARYFFASPSFKRIDGADENIYRNVPVAPTGKSRMPFKTFLYDATGSGFKPSLPASVVGVIRLSVRILSKFAHHKPSRFRRRMFYCAFV